MVLSAFFIAKQLSSGYEFAPLSPVGEAKLKAATLRIEGALQRREFDNLSNMLTRLGRRNKTALLMVETQSQQFYYSFPSQLRPDKEPFMELLEQSSPFIIKTPVGKFFGPSELKVEGKRYLLFVGERLRRGMVEQFRHQHPVTFVITIMFISGLLCAWLAWSLVRPIRQLSNAATTMAKGDLTARVGSASERGDEIGQLGQDFNHMASQVELSLDRQKRLLADISHELRSPLARLQVAIGIADNDSVSHSANLQKQLARIEKEAQMLDQMLGQLLKLSKLDAQAQLPIVEEFDFSGMMQLLVDDTCYEGQAEGKQVTMTCEANIHFLGDQDLLVSAIGNVLRNALKYCTTKVEVKVTASQSKLSISVEDDGSGVPQAQLEDIFTPFYRLSSSRTRGSGGVGLGLAIAKQAVFAHQGNIFAVSGELGGLKVVISLPKSITENH